MGKLDDPLPRDASALGKAVIDARAWTDPRFLWLANRLDLASPYEAIGMVARVWAWQGGAHTDEQDAYVVPVEVVETLLDGRWPRALVGVGLARRERCHDGAPGLHMAGCVPLVRLATRDLRAARAGSIAARAARLGREGQGRGAGGGGDGTEG